MLMLEVSLAFGVECFLCVHHLYPNYSCSGINVVLLLIAGWCYFGMERHL